MVRRHVFDGERCIHCNVNKYDCYCENDECCNEREPMKHTSESDPGPIDGVDLSDDGPMIRAIRRVFGKQSPEMELFILTEFVRVLKKEEA